MKIVHFSDSHLWYNNDSWNRDDDFYNNFLQIINETILIKPDLVIHSWDLFHNAKPWNKAISKALEWIMKLSKNNIPTLIIAWNHEVPRLTTTTNIFEIFANIPNIYPIYWEKIENIEINNLNIVALPHFHDEENFKLELSKTWEYLKNDKKNIFVSHFWIQAQEYEEYTDEISWINILKTDLENLKKYDYVALWHYHKNFNIGNMHYTWSGEHTSFNQKNYDIWYNIVDLSWSKTNVEKIKLQTRPMIDFWNIDCINFENTDILASYLTEIINKNEIIDAIVKICFINIKSSLLLEFNDNKITKIFEWSFSLEYKKIKFLSENNEISVNIINKNDIIKDNFKDYLDKYEISEDKKTLIFEEIYNKI